MKNTVYEFGARKKDAPQPHVVTPERLARIKKSLKEMRPVKRGYSRIADVDVDLSRIGYGDNLAIDFDPETCSVRISVFDLCHFCGEVVVDLKGIKG